MSWGNVRVLLDRLGQKLEHAPQDRDTREARLDILNRYLYEVCEADDWRFLQTEADLRIWQQRTYANTSNTAVTLTNGAHLITFAAGLGTFLQNGFADGLIFNDGVTDYTIGRATSTTQAYLTAPFGGVTGPNTTWSINTDRVMLPADCSQPLGYIDRANGRGRLVALDRRREEIYLSPDGTSATGNVWWLVDGDFPFDRPPDPTFAGTTSAAAGTLTANSIFQYCYTVTYEGRESQPSVIVELTTGTGAVNQNLLTGIEDVRDAGNATGKLKTLYRRQVSNGSTTTGNINGRWQRMGTLTEAATTYTDDGSVTPNVSDALALHYEGPRQFVRPRWYPSADATLRVRYLKLPRRLVADSDIPEGPPNLWELVVLLAAMDVAGSNSELAKSNDWQRKADKLRKALEGNYLQVPDRPTRRERWSVGPRGPLPVRAGTVTSDFGT